MLDKYPLLVQACAHMFNGSVCNMHSADQSLEVIAKHVAELVPLPAAAFQAAELVLLTQPAVLKQYAECGSSDNATVDLVVGAYAKAVGLE